MQDEADYSRHWDDKFSSREWGRYPPEDLVRFVGRNYKNAVRDRVSMLEVGCGPGANLWFLHREGYRVSGIDGSAAAVEIAQRRLLAENAGLNPVEPDIRVGNFASLPWPDDSFDLVIDIFAIYANTSAVIEQTLAEVFRVLKPGGRFYSKMWGTGTTGFGQGQALDAHTFDAIPAGPCFDMGVSHFFDAAEIRQKFDAFEIDAIDTVLRTDEVADSNIEEIICQCHKPDGV